ncbi:MAG: NUDIX domain-containing protein [Candidatus Paceibacterota bacterium]|jgi:colanic acid biosynthesis protein WcaH
MEYIPDELYKEILNVMPFVCVDMVIKKGDSFLLAKRTNKPAQGQWFFPGGRVLKNEKLEDAVHRKLKQETGLTGKIEKTLGVGETMFPDGPYGDSIHSVNVVFLVTPRNLGEIILDTQNNEYQWYTHIDDSWHPYVKKFLGLAGFTKVD